MTAIIPVIKAAMAEAPAPSMGMLIQRLSKNVFPPSCLKTETTVTPVASNKKKAMIRPTDHLPNLVFGLNISPPYRSPILHPKLDKCLDLSKHNNGSSKAGNIEG